MYISLSLFFFLSFPSFHLVHAEAMYRGFSRSVIKVNKVVKRLLLFHREYG